MKPLAIAALSLGSAFILSGVRKMHQASQPKYIQISQLNSHKKRKDK